MEKVFVSLIQVSSLPGIISCSRRASASGSSRSPWPHASRTGRGNDRSSSAAAWASAGRIEVVDGALAVVGVPETGRLALSRAVAAAMVGLILDELVGDPGPRPDAELDLLAAVVEDARAG